jgi:hypothetical protein
MNWASAFKISELVKYLHAFKISEIQKPFKAHA